MFGSHLSIAGSLANALREAESLKLDTVQVFTKNQRQWKVPALADEARDEWLAELRRLGWQDRTVSHNSYLANLASPDDELWKKSIDLMREELLRAQALSIPFLVFHPGAHLGSGVEAGARRIAVASAQLLKETRGSSVALCIENTAGGGTTLGRSLEELALIKRMIEDEAGSDVELPSPPASRTPHPASRRRSRVAFCIDTCHALAAGYDLDAFEAPAPSAGTPPAKKSATKKKPAGKNTPAPGRKRTVAQGIEAGERFLAEVDRVCGLDHLAAMHLNDSKGGRGSRLDRHMHIGEGRVAAGVFSAIVNHPRLGGVPKILETPKENDAKGVPMDTVNLRRLRKMMEG